MAATASVKGSSDVNRSTSSNGGDWLNNASDSLISVSLCDESIVPSLSGEQRHLVLNFGRAPRGELARAIRHKARWACPQSERELLPWLEPNETCLSPKTNHHYATRFWKCRPFAEVTSTGQGRPRPYASISLVRRQ